MRSHLFILSFMSLDLGDLLVKYCCMEYLRLRVSAKMEVYVDTLRLLAQPKEGQQFKNKKQPEVTEYQTT